jgi:predicted amidophosphoribosyltransferase
MCRSCAGKLARIPPLRSLLPGGLEVISAVRYESVAQELVRRMKFSSRLALAEVAAERMVRAWGATREGWLVPVPAAPARERARGFDDAAILARLVAESCAEARVLPCLARDDGPRQVRRTRHERTADPPRVSLLSESFVLSPGGFWLVDDVATTGATLAACARTLTDHGAKRVRALTFARADN